MSTTCLAAGFDSLGNRLCIHRLTREVPNCRKVTSDGLGYRMPDNPGDPHFSRDAAIELGKRYAEAMLK